MKIKIVHNNEIHLFRSQNPTLLGIREYIKKIFTNINDDFKLAYNDQENDQISLSCQEDLQVLIDEGIQTVKVFVITTQKTGPVPSEKMVHKRHTCDGCQKHPIIGSRFKCLECPDYDLCEECQIKNPHNHHQFFKISTQEDLHQFRKENWNKNCNWARFGGSQPQGFCHENRAYDAFKQFREFFKDPAFKELKQTVCTIAQDVISVVKTEIDKHKNSQQQQEQPQEENTLNDKKETQYETQEETQQETQQETQKEKKVKFVSFIQNECNNQDGLEEKIRTLVEILQCDEKVAKEYIELFKELTLNEIVDIILEKN